MTKKDLNLADFDQTVNELTKLLDQLEKNDNDLNQALIDFEQASKLLKSAQKKLDLAKLKVETLIGDQLKEDN